MGRSKSKRQQRQQRQKMSPRESQGERGYTQTERSPSTHPYFTSIFDLPYQRVSELRRKSNFLVRPGIAFARFVLYLILIPTMICGAVVGASLQLGATWDEAMDNVVVVRDATIETYETHWDLVKLSAEILLDLEDEVQTSELELMEYVAEVKSKTSALSAKVDRALADYLKQQVRRRKRLQTQGSDDVESDPEEPMTLYKMMKASALGAAIPLSIYWVIGFLFTRFWLNLRARETLGSHRNRVSDLRQRK